MAVRYLTKDQMIQKLRELAVQGWIMSRRPLNAGGIGNTIDSLLGLPENNLPIADTAQWELKTHRIGSSSLLTLFHMEPQPREFKIVVNSLLPMYGWPDQKRPDELSFRQTLQATHLSDRGFGIFIDRRMQKILVYFESSEVDTRHSKWLDGVESKGGLTELKPQPYWTFKEVFLKASTKLLNTFYVETQAKRYRGNEYFKLNRLHILQGLDLNKFITALKKGAILIDFDARSHHNHGTKFRIRQEFVPDVYQYTDVVDFDEAIK